MTKKRGLGILKNFFHSLQVQVVKIPKENHPISSGRKKGSMNSQNKVYLHVVNMRNN